MIKKILFCVVICCMGITTIYAGKPRHILACEISNGALNNGETNFSTALTSSYTGSYYLLPGTNNLVEMNCSFPGQDTLRAKWLITNSGSFTSDSPYIKCSSPYSACESSFKKTYSFKWGVKTGHRISIKFRTCTYNPVDCI